MFHLSQSLSFPERRRVPPVHPHGRPPLAGLARPDQAGTVRRVRRRRRRRLALDRCRRPGWVDRGLRVDEAVSAGSRHRRRGDVGGGRRRWRWSSVMHLRRTQSFDPTLF